MFASLSRSLSSLADIVAGRSALETNQQSSAFNTIKITNAALAEVSQFDGRDRTAIVQFIQEVEIGLYRLQTQLTEQNITLSQETVISAIISKLSDEALD